MDVRHVTAAIWLRQAQIKLTLLCHGFPWISTFTLIQGVMALTRCGEGTVGLAARSHGLIIQTPFCRGGSESSLGVRSD